MTISMYSFVKYCGQTLRADVNFKPRFDIFTILKAKKKK